MSLDTVTLQCFLAVAETQSFTKAALRIGRTQSAVSQQIAKLENMLDKALFNRGRELSLTTDGELFLGYATRIYELHRESLDRFKAPELHGELRFGLPEDFASMMLSDVLLEFTRLHPRVMLNVQCDLTLNLIERYKKGEFDLILIKINQDYELTDIVTVWNEPVEWVGKKDLLPALDKNTIIPLVLSPSPCVYRGDVIDSLDKHRMDWRLVYISPSYAGKMAAVRAGLGITAIQRSLIPNDLDRLDFSFLPSLNDIQVSLLKKRDNNKAVESLEYFILKKLKH
ncbi:LysR substrate-binding domain-containing protein [Legionella israelensis]|uniref:LysR family transcriptional regulator n=1 Tax=Legionella israelensis TaxID=454 RepID=A0A0W0WDR5_9GAMM|nr:LysR substrate-binding domain-containing protein [Legionella israelensis]KTD30513.1 LysR family transcriptional regulator [Legionella israelensis]QBS09063.1 LysR family transcriptional regulator [Legionella israelensis]SCY51507.1 transcriptional regulator, LysR family [Legionella israelensis DSM 19235]STX58780.1 LysR family transcriptional regulator [Legionella israelensis]